MLVQDLWAFPAMMASRPLESQAVALAFSEILYQEFNILYIMFKVTIGCMAWYIAEVESSCSMQRHSQSFEDGSAVKWQGR